MKKDGVIGIFLSDKSVISAMKTADKVEKGDKTGDNSTIRCKSITMKTRYIVTGYHPRLTRSNKEA